MPFNNFHTVRYLQIRPDVAFPTFLPPATTQLNSGNPGNNFAAGVRMSNLKELRKAAGLTQIQLAMRANVSRFRLCLAETGNIELRPEELAAITEAVKPEIERTARIASEFTTLSAIGA